MIDPGSVEPFAWNDKVILIAEDQKINFILLKTIFERTNATVIWAQDGEEAIESFMKSDHIDLVIMDFRMPKIDGIEAAKIIKEKNQNVPVIFHTANSLEDEDLSGIAYQDIVYFQKPVNPKVLLDKAKDLLEK